MWCDDMVCSESDGHRDEHVGTRGMHSLEHTDVCRKCCRSCQEEADCHPSSTQSHHSNAHSTTMCCIMCILMNVSCWYVGHVRYIVQAISTAIDTLAYRCQHPTQTVTWICQSNFPTVRFLSWYGEIMRVTIQLVSQ